MIVPVRMKIIEGCFEWTRTPKFWKTLTPVRIFGEACMTVISAKLAGKNEGECRYLNLIVRDNTFRIITYSNSEGKFLVEEYSKIRTALFLRKKPENHRQT